MRAIVLHDPGGPSPLRLDDLPAPACPAGHVLLRVRACGVCYHDVVVAQGALRRGVKPSLVLGHEIAGEVAAVAPDIGDVSLGDRVVTLLTSCCGACQRCRAGLEHRCLAGHGIGHGIDGGYAEYVAVTAASLVPIPAGVTFEQASLAACPAGVALRALRAVAALRDGEAALITGAALQALRDAAALRHGETVLATGAALQALRDAAALRHGETVLITGAGGGVGVHAVQIAMQLGARVLAVTGSPDKADRLRALGAEVIVSPALDFHYEVEALTDGAGVSVVLDTVGAPAFPAALRSLSQYGRIVLVGDLSGDRISFSPASLLFKDAAVLGSSGANRSDVAGALAMIASGRLRPIYTAFPLHDASLAHRMLLERRLFGRAVLVP